ncbi:MAG: SDR family oxidoreductase [Candidatus Roizmanbacteria bacterium]|nr:MAG: SDR family oxidoreductase [Candidatus Roizmanbacteria bacterium]
MNILITGGAGFIGSNLTQYHLNLNDDIYIIDNLVTGNKKNIEELTNKKKLTFIEADITSFDFLKLPVFDVIYHLASPASPVQYKKYNIETMMTNSLGTYKMLEFFKSSGSKTFVISSTSETYGDPLVHPQTEDYWGNVNPVGVRSCYDEAKRFSEALVMSYYRRYDLNVRIARIFNTYGHNMEKNDGRVVSNFIMQSITNEPLTVYGKGDQTRSFCFVSDMIEGLYALGKTDNIKGEVINLGNPNEMTVLKLANLVKKMTDTKSEIVFKPLDEDDPKKRKPDISKAKKLLNWQPSVSIEEGMRKTIVYFKQRFL